MKNVVVRIIINVLALLVVVNVVSGASIINWGTLIAAAIVIAVLNAVIKPFLLLLTLPINVLTLGIFTLFINAFLMYLTSALVKGFYVESFWSAFWGALVFSVVSIVLNMFVDETKGKNNGRRIQ